MLSKELYKQFIVFITLCFFLLSTSGIVLFYHSCHYSNKILVSLYIDSTEELCADSFVEYSEKSNNPHLYCCIPEFSDHKDDGMHCEHHHKSNYKTAKIHSVYNSSNQLTIPKPIALTVLSYAIPLELSPDNAFKSIYKKLPPELPIRLPSGKDIIIRNHSFKIYC